MKLREFGCVADENVDPEVVVYLRSAGWNVRTVAELGLLGRGDLDVLRAAVAERRVVLTHDSDFGALAMKLREPLVGVIYVRPAHINAAFTIGTLGVLLRQDPVVRPPFFIVARRRADDVAIRVRML